MTHPAVPARDTRAPLRLLLGVDAVPDTEDLVRRSDDGTNCGDGLAGDRSEGVTERIADVGGERGRFIVPEPWEGRHVDDALVDGLDQKLGVLEILVCGQGWKDVVLRPPLGAVANRTVCREPLAALLHQGRVRLLREGDAQ
jgi:hypothetical protein